MRSTGRNRAIALIVAVLVVVVVALIVTSGSDSSTTKTQPIVVKLADKEKAQAKRRARTATKIAAATVQLWSCQDKLTLLGVREGRDRLQSPWSLPRSVPYREWVLTRRANRQKSCMKRFHYVSAHLIPDIQDWQGAIQWVQRIYPGTYDWLYTISDREGCRTVGDCPWVWYGSHPWKGHHVGNDFLGSDTVGGPMQFRYSTFAPYWRGAQKDLVSRGYIIPNFRMPPAGGDPKYAAWLNPMGQALTAAYMRYTDKDGCHWCL